MLGKNLLLGVAVGLGATLTASGCAYTGLSSETKPGFVFTDVTEGGAAEQGGGGSKMGKACSENYLGIVSMGDASIDAAMKAGGLTTVKQIDRSYFSVLGFYGEFCVLVRGE